MFKLSELNQQQGRVVRECKAPFIHVDADGNEKTAQIRVRYISRSISESKAFRRAIQEKESTGDLYMSDLLLPMIDSLPDFTDDKGLPVDVTIEVLDSINSINLRAISKAIDEDIAGPKVNPGK